MDLQPGHALLDAIRTTAQNKDAQQASEILSDLSATIDLIASFPAPTIAAVEGSCVGAGLEIALACDLRVMARTAVVAFPETRVGFIPDLGGTARAVQRLGAGGAALLILTGRRINADTAHALRLTEALADTGEALAEAYRLADEILAGAPIAIEQALQVLRLAPDLVLADALAVEKEAGVAALLSGECLEGIDAFLERRTPQWEGE
jgi:enoyl-CoA hydratase